ncbi:uncharacterized protein AAGF69_000176 isoform 1-T1 [Amazona ochrocephala]
MTIGTDKNRSYSCFFHQAALLLTIILHTGSCLTRSCRKEPITPRSRDSKGPAGVTARDGWARPPEQGSARRKHEVFKEHVKVSLKHGRVVWKSEEFWRGEHKDLLAVQNWKKNRSQVIFGGFCIVSDSPPHPAGEYGR